MLRLCPGSWFREERRVSKEQEGTQGRGASGKLCRGAAKRPLGIWVGHWPGLSGEEEGCVGHVAVWQEGSLASTLTHFPTTGMAEVHQRVVSLGQVPLQRPLKCLKKVMSEAPSPQVISRVGLSVPQLLRVNREDPPAALGPVATPIKL